MSRHDVELNRFLDREQAAENAYEALLEESREYDYDFELAARAQMRDPGFDFLGDLSMDESLQSFANQAIRKHYPVALPINYDDDYDQYDDDAVKKFIEGWIEKQIDWNREQWIEDSRNWEDNFSAEALSNQRRAA